MLTAVTVSDLLHQLGDIPPERVRLQPPPGTATAADVVAVHNREDRLCELVDGVLVEKTIGYYESYIAATLIRLLGNFVVAHDLGIVAGADGMMRLAPGLVRIPDVSFVSWEKLPGRRPPRQAIPDLEAIRKVWIALTYGSHGYYPIFTEVSPMTTPIRKPYLTDLTDDQWHLLQPHQHHPVPQPHGVPMGHAATRSASQEHRL